MSLRDYNTLKLQQALIEVTIGGAKGAVDRVRKKEVFSEYVRRAFPDAQVLDIRPTDTSAALNSVSGIITLKFADGRVETVFGKVHVESNTRQLSPLGAEQEYQNAGMLAEAGWPVLEPVARSNDPDYPLLLYPVVIEPVLFDMLERSHLTGKVVLTGQDFVELTAYERQIGQKETASLRIGSSDDARTAPVQTLFERRFAPGGRIDKWYTPSTLFAFPGVNPVAWADLLDKTWVINGQKYDVTLRKIIGVARDALSFTNESQACLILSHGDDHAGNVRLTKPPTAFDPAFAGWNPASLELKALAHTGFLPMAAMYYVPKGLNVTYSLGENEVIVETNEQSLPAYKTHEKLAQLIIGHRIKPLIKTMRRKGADMAREEQRIRSGLAGCALLTVNIAELLSRGDGRAVGLLPMTIRFYELSGLPMLEYLRSVLQGE